MLDFKWIAWNLDKIDKHGLTREEVEHAANSPARGYPRRIDRDKFLAWGQTPAGLYVQVIYVVEPDLRVFLIHARPLTENEKRKLRRRRR